jgi:hypothetical protein
MRAIRTIFLRHPLLTSAFALALLVTLFFGGRLIVSAIYWSAHQQEAVRPWMTVGYVGRSWGVQPRRIDEVAGLPVPVNGKPLTLEDIAQQRGVPVQEIIEQVEAAIATLQAEKKND